MLSGISNSDDDLFADEDEQGAQAAKQPGRKSAKVEGTSMYRRSSSAWSSS